MTYRWVSWYAIPGTMTEIGKFELHYPWWITGVRCSDGAETVVAAIPVVLKDEAHTVIQEAHDYNPPEGVELEIRFNDLKEGSPFSDRFIRRKWMKWPDAAIKARGEKK